MHRQHKCGRRVGFAEYAKNARRNQGTRPSATERRRNSQREQTGFRQILEILEREAALAVMCHRPFRKDCGKARSAPDAIGSGLLRRFPRRDVA
jgi:hypothetical protein